MASPYYYYVYPFGLNADDVPATIPTPAAGDGSMSYYAGFTPFYEEDLLTNPSALPIPRSQFNQLMLDITNNLQEYQQFGTPQFILAAQNLGSAFPYPIYARVYYNGVVYENQVASNTATPGTDNTWLITSGNASGVPIGVMLDFAGVTPPADYLLCDGSAVSRSTYSGLQSAITFSLNGTTTNTVNTLTSLSSTANMYVGMALEGAGIPTGATVASITSGTAITMSAVATASATVPVTFFSWGNGNGTTTFNVPDYRRRTSVGSGGTASTDPLGIGSVTGQHGGEEGHSQTSSEVGTHAHANTGDVSGFICGGGAGGVAEGSSTAGWTLKNTTATAGSGTAFNIIQPSNVVTKIIRYK